MMGVKFRRFFAYVVVLLLVALLIISLNSNYSSKVFSRILYKPNYHSIEFQLNHTIFNSTNSKQELLRFRNIETLRNQYNQAQFVHGLNHCMKYRSVAGKIIFVTNLIDITKKASNQRLIFGRAPTRDELQVRLLEVINGLQKNLNHEQIKNVFILVEDHNTLELLRKINFENSSKLIIQNVQGTIGMTTQIELTTRCFKDEIVAIGNQDNVFGNGWDVLNWRYLKENRVMYALTRHSSVINKNCSFTREVANCEMEYIGSHDAYVFHVKEYIKEETFKVLQNKIFNVYGMENIMIATFKKVLKYKVTNPCSIIKIHHEHCIPIRNKRKRVPNKGNNYGLAPYTYTIY